VVIPTGGDRPILAQALRAVLDDEATAEAIVVLASADPQAAEVRRTVERLRDWSDSEPRLRLITSLRDGVGPLTRVQRARDTGVEAASSEVVLSLDDDVILGPGVVSRHAAAHRDADDLVVIGYMPVATHHRWPRGNATIRFYAGAYEAHCERYETAPEEILKAMWGGNISVRRGRWLDAVKRPRLGIYDEDQELGLLFVREGLRGRFDRSLHGRHFYERSLAAFAARAGGSSVGQAQLRAANPDLLAPRPHERGRRDLPAGPLLALARLPFGWRLIEGGLKLLLAVAGTLRINRLGDALARFLWFLAAERAMRAAGV
jgi:hypothetical protein